MPPTRSPSVFTRVWVTCALLGLLVSVCVVVGHATSPPWALLLAVPLGVGTALLLLHGVWR